MRGHPIRYSAEELKWLKANRKLVIGEYAHQFAKKFGREISAVALHALRKRKGWKTGRSGQFVKGQEPANKGQVCPEGTGGRHPNARKTQFKKGSLSGSARARVKPIGFERISKDGYRERKIHNGLSMQSRWRLVHLLEWEKLNGPVPEGHALKCVDGNRLNVDPQNWIAVSRSLLPRLAGGRHDNHTPYDTAPDELKPVILATAKLAQKSREVRKA